MSEGITFVYRIQHPCSMMIWFTTDPDEAEHASRNGCIVTTPPISRKIYKHSSNTTNLDGEVW